MAVIGAVVVALTLAEPAWRCARRLAGLGRSMLAGALAGSAAVAVLLCGYIAALLLSLAV